MRADAIAMRRIAAGAAVVGAIVLSWAGLRGRVRDRAPRSERSSSSAAAAATPPRFEPPGAGAAAGPAPQGSLPAPFAVWIADASRDARIDRERARAFEADVAEAAAEMRAQWRDADRAMEALADSVVEGDSSGRSEDVAAAVAQRMQEASDDFSVRVEAALDRVAPAEPLGPVLRDRLRSALRDSPAWLRDPPAP